MKKVDYGFDAPKVVVAMLVMALVLCVGAFLIPYWFYSSAKVISVLVSFLLFITALSFLYPACAIIWGSRVLKFRERDWLLDLVNIKGHETILDVGCGRGLLLIGAAKKLSQGGKAIGIDIWQAQDQAFNAARVTERNASLEGVADTVEVITADARSMPFPDASFDSVISSWALHNIPDKEGRLRALQEIKRVLKPQGTVCIMDIYCTQEYAAFFKEHGFSDVNIFGPRYTFGTPTYIVKAQKS